MKVKELIKRLTEFPQDMTVAIADWNEGESNPCRICVEEINITQFKYYDPDVEDWVSITCVVIGEEP